MKFYWMKRSSDPMTGVLIRREKSGPRGTEMEGRGHGATEAEIWRCGLKPRNSKDGGQPAEPRKVQGSILPDKLQMDYDPANIVISNFWPPELKKNKPLLF